jgi:hypothetical protein
VPAGWGAREVVGVVGRGPAERYVAPGAQAVRRRGAHGRDRVGALLEVEERADLAVCGAQRMSCARGLPQLAVRPFENGRAGHDHICLLKGGPRLLSWVSSVMSARGAHKARRERASGALDVWLVGHPPEWSRVPKRVACAVTVRVVALVRTRRRFIR